MNNIRTIQSATALNNAYVQQELFPQATADELDNGLAPSHRVLDAGYAHNDVAGNLVIGTARVPALSPVYMTQAAYDASAPHDPFVAYIIVTS